VGCWATRRWQHRGGESERCGIVAAARRRACACGVICVFGGRIALTAAAAYQRRQRQACASTLAWRSAAGRGGDNLGERHRSAASGVAAAAAIAAKLIGAGRRAAWRNSINGGSGVIVIGCGVHRQKWAARHSWPGAAAASAIASASRKSRRAAALSLRRQPAARQRILRHPARQKARLAASRGRRVAAKWRRRILACQPAPRSRASGLQHGCALARRNGCSLTAVGGGRIVEHQAVDRYYSRIASSGGIAAAVAAATIGVAVGGCWRRMEHHQRHISGRRLAVARGEISGAASHLRRMSAVLRQPQRWATAAAGDRQSARQASGGIGGARAAWPGGKHMQTGSMNNDAISGENNGRRWRNAGAQRNHQRGGASALKAAHSAASYNLAAWRLIKWRRRLMAAAA